MALLLAMACFLSCRSFVGGNDKYRIILNLLGGCLSDMHYEPITFDDNFSSKVFDEYILGLDYSKRFLLKSDVDKLEEHRYLIDDYIRNYDVDFCESVTMLLKTRQKEAQKYFEEIIGGDIDLYGSGWVQTEPDSLDFAADAEDMRGRWRQLITLAVLERYYDMKKTQDKAVASNDTTVKVKTDDEIKADAVERIRENYTEWMKRINGLKDYQYYSIFFNSIVAACDPHSEYLPPADKTNFDISMSGKFEGIGATLQSKNGQTKVVDIIPGSASWRQGELEVGDIITMVGQGDDEPVDVSNMDLEDVVQKIRGKKGSIVKLTVKKVDASVKVIAIERDVVVIEETYVKSSVLTLPGVEGKVGYIYLPKFYTDFNDKNGRSCSRDIQQELIKLKSENVSGVIMDLRNNGGGSLHDVVDMTGLFVGNGPMVQVRTRDNKNMQHHSKNMKKEYDGPLVVMINSYSASASEIIAAALQDYDRAIIMGSQSSFGKGTVQSILDFDQANVNPSMKPLGALKLTIQKFYRVSGGTTQLRGVIPDIVLPDVYSYMKVGEKEMHNALQYDVVKPAYHDKIKHGYNKKKVISASQQRIKNNEVFCKIDENAKRLKKRDEQTLFPLNYDKYKEYHSVLEAENEKYSKLGKDETGIKATFLSNDRASAEGDTLKTKKMTKWFGELEKDIYIMEAVNVINDMNSL